MLTNTERLLLRPLVDADAPAIAILRSNDEVNRYIERAKFCTLEDAHAFIERIKEGTKNGKTFYWAICLKETGELIGTVCLFNFSEDKKTAELGYELNTPFHGKGFMNEAVAKVIDFCFSTLKLRRIKAFTHQDNKSSIKLLLKNGFTLDVDRKSEEHPLFQTYYLDNPSEV
jgi:ribosomal-protein-alanine N-acetyltransferase